MFEITVEETFAAAHALRGYRGKCENTHGHNYRVRVRLAGPRLDAVGMLYDFKDLKRLIRAETERLDHRFLNEIEPFDALNPSAENIARDLFERLRAGLASHPEGVEVAEVAVWETDTTAALYRG